MARVEVRQQATAPPPKQTPQRVEMAIGKSRIPDPASGLMANLDDMQGDDLLVATLSLADHLVCGGDGKWKQLLADTPANNYDLDFTTYDAALALFPAGKVLRHHPVLWSKEDYFPDSFDFSTVAGRITQYNDYIDVLMTKYAGTFDYIDAWNEPISTTASGTAPDLKNPTVGEATTVAEIGSALDRIASHDAVAKLGINDFKTEFKGAKFEHFYELLRQLLDGGHPLHYAGFQCHLACYDAPSEEQMYSNFKRVKDLGLEVLITELDIRLTGLSSGASVRAKTQTQESVARRVFGAARRAGVTVINWWGVRDDTWWGHASQGGPYGTSYPDERPAPCTPKSQPKTIFDITRGVKR